ncbi:MAG: hypothetical protein HFG27_05435 [Provencibacterium sp.]|nr:hypothetical protein [Provencibacterium sp.]
MKKPPVCGRFGWPAVRAKRCCPVLRKSIKKFFKEGFSFQEAERVNSMKAKEPVEENYVFSTGSFLSESAIEE